MGTQTLKAGILIGHRYQLESLLGQGGLGRVYLARDLLEGETRVALKILATPQRINGQWVSLRQELSLLARLRHPNLAHIRDFGILEGNRAPFVAEDFVAGDDLLTATAGWHTAQIVELLVSVSRVVQYLHSYGVVHQDLKPSNIVLPAGVPDVEKVKVLDFGLARCVPSAGPRVVPGALPYAAPELLLGNPATTRSDLYSLGVLFYQLLTHRLPFEDEDPGFLIQKHLQGRPDMRAVEILENGPRLAQVILGLMEKDPARRPSSSDDLIRLLRVATARDFVSPREESPEIYFSAGPFVGRDREMTLLKERAVRVLETGRGWTTFVLGESGAGKSRTMEELRTWALLEGWRVVEAGCQQSDDQSYPPFREILARTDRVSRALGNTDQEIFRFEDLPHVADSSSLDLAADSAAGRFRDLLTREVVRRLAGGPTLVLLHDFHWADEATVAVLDYLSSDVSTHPIYMCVSSRLHEMGDGPLCRLVEHMPRQERGDRLAVEALSQDAIGHLIAGVLRDEQVGGEITSWLYQTSGGNPFFVEEILKHLVDRGLLSREQGRWRLEKEGLGKLEVPKTVAIVLRHRIEHLSKGAQEVAAWMAVFGHPISKHSLGQVVSGDAEEFDNAISGLIRRSVIRAVTEAGEESYEFRHSLISEVIRSGLGSRRRARMHRRIGDYLESRNDAEQRLQEIALHFTEGGYGEKSVTYAWRAAAACRLEFANEAALRFYEYVLRRARHLSREQMCEAALEAAEVCYSLGVPRRAIRLLDAQLRLIGRRQHPDLRAKLYTKLAHSYGLFGDVPGSQKAASQGLICVRQEGFPDKSGATEAILLHELAFCMLVKSQPTKGLKLLQRALDCLSGNDVTAHVGRIYSLISALCWLKDDLDGGVKASTRAVHVLEALGSVHLLPLAYSHLGCCLYGLARFRLALEQHRHAVEISERTRSVFQQAQALGNLAECLCRSGQFAEALEIADRAVRLAKETENRDWVHVCASTLMGIYISIGRYSKAQESLQELLSNASPRLPKYVRTQALFCSAWLHIEMGNVRSCSAELQKLRASKQCETPPYESALVEVLQARVYLEAGNNEKALLTLTNIYREIRGRRRPYPMCVVRLCLSETFFRLGELQSARRFARDAIRLARAMPSKHLESQGHLALGRTYSRGIQFSNQGGTLESRKGLATVGDLTDARRELQKGLSLAEMAGSEELVWRAHVELARIEKASNNKGDCIFHAQAALRLLSSIESQVPLRMLDCFRMVLERDKGRKDCESFVLEHEDSYRKASNLQVRMIKEEHLRVLCRISHLVTGFCDMDSLLEAITDLTIEGIHSERAMIFLKDADSGKLRLAKARNSKRESLERAEHVRQSILDEAHRLGYPFVSANLPIDPRADSAVISDQLGSLFCAPLKVGSKTLGVLYADHPDAVGSFDESVINLFAAVCNLAGLAIDNALLQRCLREEKIELESHLQEARGGYQEIVGQSAVIDGLRERIAQAASSPMDVLITGESGTGKELVAVALHRTGRRSGREFVPLDCGSLSESLIESELFGYRKGSFTGAVDSRPGLLEIANGGVVFFDEISNLSIKLQSKLLRVLQEREVRRLGEASTRKVDIQVIAATNQNLREAVRRGKFRKDLYYRVNAFEIRVPPIRERMEDIPILVDWFLKKTAEGENGRTKSFSREAFELLKEYRFPGNVRQLKNVVQRAYYLSPGRTIGLGDLDPEIRGTDVARSSAHGITMNGHARFQRIVEGKGTFKELVKEPFLRREVSSAMVRRVIHRALTKTAGKYRDAFRILGINDTEYSVTLVFLKRHGCYLNFRHYRRTSGVAHRNH